MESESSGSQGETAKAYEDKIDKIWYENMKNYEMKRRKVA